MSEELHKPEPPATEDADETLGAVSRPSMIWRAVHLFALAGFAVAQPLFGLLGSEPEFWIARDASYVDVVALLVTVLVAVPALIFFVEWIINFLSPVASWVFHVVAVGGFFALIALDVVDTVSGQTMRGLFVMAIAAIIGTLLAVAYLRVKWVRDLTGIMAIGPVAFAVLLILSLPPLGGSDAETVDVGVTSDASVVFVVLDEFQLAAILDESGAIDATRFPNIARLAAMSTWYPNATTVHDNTLKAVPAILSGSYPSNDKLATADDYPVNLFTTLGATHEMIVDEAVTQLCPVSVCGEPLDTESVFDHLTTLGVDSGIIYLHSVVPTTLRYRLPPIGTRWEGFLRSSGESVDAPSVDADRGEFEASLGVQTGDEARSVKFGAFLDSLEPTVEPALFYVHVDLPHAPWSMLENGKRYPYSDVIPSYTPEGIWMNDYWYVQQAFGRYLQNIAFTDLLVGETLDRLSSQGMLDEALLVFVSDHGENFVINETRRAISGETLAAVGGVPLFIKYPGQMAGSVDESNVQTIDVLPTVVDTLGGSLSGADGRSLLSGLAPSTKRLLTNAGGEFVLTASEYEALAAAHLNDVLGILPTGSGLAATYAAVGPLPELNGRSVSDFVVTERAGTTEVSSQQVVNDFDPSGPLDPVAVPVVVTVADGAIPAYFAVAVNGRVLTTMTPYLVDGSSASIYAIIPPGSFGPGQNSVAIFGIVDSEDEMRLVRYA